MKYASSPTSMQVAVGSVNCRLKVKPSASKKSMERCRSATGMLTKSFRGLIGFVPAFLIAGPAVCVAVIGSPVVVADWTAETRGINRCSGCQLERQPKPWKQRLDVQVRRLARDLVALEVEDDDGPGCGPAV